MMRIIQWSIFVSLEGLMKWASRVLSRQYRAKNIVLSRTIYFCLSISFAAVSTSVFAAENIATPVDSNSRITVENTVVKGDETTVFFLTHPDIGDPNAGKPCPLNYYSVKLRPGLPDAKINLVAKGVCSGLMQKSRLLDNGDALMIVGDRLERWRAGKQIDSQAFSSMDADTRLPLNQLVVAFHKLDESSIFFCVHCICRHL